MKRLALPLQGLRQVTRRLLQGLTVCSLLIACTTPTGLPVPLATPTPSVSAPVLAPLPALSSAEQTALRMWVAQQDRLYFVAAPLLSANTALCKGNARNLLGFSAKNRYSYSDAYADAAQTLFGLGERLQVMDVLPGSGAAQAGVRRGDVLFRIEGLALPLGRNATREAAAVLAPLVADKTTVRLDLQRGERQLSLSISLTNACAFGIELGNTDAISAYNDGRRVLITRGMLNFVQSDEELAYVLAREMAHTILGHPQKQKSAAAADSLIDNLIRMHPEKGLLQGKGGLRAMPQGLDVSADQLALYLLARAGYGIENVGPFWQGLAAKLPPTVVNGYTALHPATAARLASIAKTSVVLRQRIKDKQPLMP